MDPSHIKALFKNKKTGLLLKKFRCGIERETLRTDKEGFLSQTPHPKALGAPLTHPHIGTDFGEAQLEWNTPPRTSFRAGEKCLQDLMSFSARQLKGELFWPFSMPCPLSHIQIARYGTSHAGRQREIYREGLRFRYGCHLQMISSIHFNFSFSKPFWEMLLTCEKSPLSLKDFISEKYLHLIRNFLRDGWLLTYLFGSSPAMDVSYISPPPKGFKKLGDHTLYAPWASSIRMSRLGYYSRIQNQYAISFNDLKSYIRDMRHAISTPKAAYANIPSQLNTHIFQSENEHYSRIRPKTTPHQGESLLEAIEKRGIEYVEVRSIDLDPYHPLGMSREYLCFLHHFLLYCLFKPSPKLSQHEQTSLAENQNRIALEGRKKNLLLCNGKSLQLVGQNILKQMEPLASLLESEKVWEKQKEKVENPQLTPSEIIANDVKQMGMRKMGIELAKRHKKMLLKAPISSKTLERFKNAVQKSHVQTKYEETASKVILNGFENLELSTQILIRKALEKKIKVEVLDWSNQLIALTWNGKTEYVKQATKTSKDTYIVPYLLENKEVTKQFLHRAGLRVPKGKIYGNLKAALNAYPLYKRRKVVVKPNSTNFGVGVCCIEKGEELLYLQAVREGLMHASSILVEEYCPGEELRFLVIDGKVIAVAKREAANIIGNGKQTIRELVRSKNEDPSYYRHPKHFLHLGKIEKRLLHKQSLTPLSIPKKGKKIFLRHNSNVSTGGDPIDMTDQVHSGYKRLAAQAAKTLGATICGVDIMMTAPKKPPSPKNYALIELNYNPVLFIHSFPYKGKSRDVASPILNLLFKVGVSKVNGF